MTADSLCPTCVASTRQSALAKVLQMKETHLGAATVEPVK